MSLKKPLIILAILLSAARSSAQQDTNGDGRIQVLIPLVFSYPHGGSKPDVIDGAYGSRWTGEVWLHNGSDDNLQVLQQGEICPCRIQHPKRTTTPVRVLDVGANPNRGGLWSFAPIGEKLLTFSARVFELSRRSQPNGVEVPIVWEREFLSEEAWLIGIPRTSDSRVALRVYDPRRRDGSAVTVEFLTLDGQLIASTSMTPGAAGEFDSSVNIPRSVAINDLQHEFPALNSHDRFDIRIRPLTPGTEYWAFATVTDRDTQHVLFITPDQ